MAILSKLDKRDNSESHKSLKLCFTNIQGLNAECESFLESKFPDTLALCETKMDDSIYSCNFSVSGYLPLIWKNSVTCMDGVAVDVKQELPFAWDLSVENCGFLVMCLTGFTSFSVLLLLPLWIICLHAWFLMLLHLT